jgi:membrane fusion protein, multidrug efflux system
MSKAIRVRPVLVITALLGLLQAGAAAADTLAVAPVTVTEWKPVFGQVAARDTVPARARLGGTVAALDVTEGDRVTAGQRIALVEDTKLLFEIDALEARLSALRAQLDTARAELARGEALLERGVIASQRVEQLQTQVSVLDGQVLTLGAERQVVERQIAEGAVLAPEAGIVLSVPVSRGSVVTPGEAVAIVGGGGLFLRLSVPERHARDLAPGDRIEIGSGSDVVTGTLARLYPLIEGGRVQADVEVEGLDQGFVGGRVPVRLPVGERQAILVPDAALTRAGGLDFVTVQTPEGPVDRAVVPGAIHDRDGVPWREILTGLAAGDIVVTPDE